MPLNCALKNGKIYVTYIFTTTKKCKKKKKGNKENINN